MTTGRPPIAYPICAELTTGAGRCEDRSWWRKFLRTAMCLLPWLAPSPGVCASAMTIEGLGTELEANVRAFVALENEACDAPRWRIRRRYAQLDEQLRRALEAYGYYQPLIEKELRFEPQCWGVELRIDAGRPVAVRRFEFRIDGPAGDDPAFAKLRRGAEIAVGKPLRHAAYTSLKQRLQRLGADQGYFDADFSTAKIDVWPSEYAADIALHYQSGERYRFGDIRLLQDFLEADLVNRYVRIGRGDPYTASAIAELQQSLNGSGYFSQVDIRPDFDAAIDRHIPLSVSLSAAERIEYTIGAGFSTDIGPRLRGGYENRRVNSRGHQLRAGLLLSPVLGELSTTYRLPWGNREREWLNFTTGVQSEDTETSDSIIYDVGVKRVKQLAGEWIRTDGLRLKHDRFRVSDVEDRSTLLMPSIGFSRTRADRAINPDRGYFFSTELRGASETLGSTTNFLQLLGSANWIAPLGRGGRLLLRARGGTTLKDALRELPPSVRFFAGGLETVRGHGFETLGPKDDNGVVIGGSHLLAVSAEYERLIYRTIAGAVFVDGGNAFDGTRVDARIAAGLGLKWRSPIGTLRVYLAHPLNFSDRSVRVHVGIGPDL